MKLHLQTIRREAEDTLSFLFGPEEPFSWKAGQYLRYKLPHPDVDSRGDERYFTIASAPHERFVMLTARFASQGSSFKRALCRLNRGDVIEADELGGDFVVDSPDGQHIFIAGGIGVTPFRAILLDLHHRQLPINATLLYSNRADDFPYRRELEQLRPYHARLDIRYFIHPERIDKVTVEKFYRSQRNPIVYVSGPEKMVEHFDALLKGMGLGESNIRTDYFPGYEWVDELETKAT